MIVLMFSSILGVVFLGLALLSRRRSKKSAKKAFIKTYISKTAADNYDGFDSETESESSFDAPSIDFEADMAAFEEARSSYKKTKKQQARSYGHLGSESSEDLVAPSLRTRSGSRYREKRSIAKFDKRYG